MCKILTYENLIKLYMKFEMCEIAKMYKMRSVN
jgi:hypothetical protein